MKKRIGVIKLLATFVSLIAWIAVVFVLCAGMKYKVYTVISESMLPVLEVGDSVIAKVSVTSDCNEGDIIVYSNKNGINIIHRIVFKGTDASDKALSTYLIAKGDNNDFEDKERITDDNNVYRVVVMPNERLNNLISIVKSKLFKACLVTILLLGPSILIVNDTKSRNKTKIDSKNSNNYKEDTKIMKENNEKKYYGEEAVAEANIDEAAEETNEAADNTGATENEECEHNCGHECCGKCEHKCRCEDAEAVNDSDTENDRLSEEDVYRLCRLFAGVPHVACIPVKIPRFRKRDIIAAFTAGALTAVGAIAAVVAFKRTVK